VAGSLGEPELVVGPGGKVEGSIRVPVVTIFGTVTGTVVASRSLTLMPGARVDGELFYGALSIRKGALVTGTLVNGDEGRARAQRVEPSQDPEPSAEYSEHPTLSTA
jgi:cytoskeletal protein CcmA (bactofilin family)